MSEAIMEAVRNVITADWLAIIIVAMIPVVELRGAILLAAAMSINTWLSLLLAFVGSTIVVPILLLLLKPILNLLKKIKIFALLARAIEDMFNGKAEQIVEKVQSKGGKKDGKLAEKIKFFGVLIFVAVPIPLTGVWTGAAVAVFLNMKFGKALLAVSLGNLIAGLIVTAISVLFGAYIDIILSVFAFIVLIMFIIFFYKVILHMIKLNKLDKLATDGKPTDETTTDDKKDEDNK